jgi:hypothetical protein
MLQLAGWWWLHTKRSGVMALAAMLYVCSRSVHCWQLVLPPFWAGLAGLASTALLLVHL